MSTVTSPRVSESVQSPSSSRTSLDLPTAPRPQPPSQRRNRAALRDYYGLKTAAGNSQDPVELVDQIRKEPIPTSELDNQGFDAPAYVKSILANQNLETVLKTESELISEIKNLDGERKALVYDNYSKLIAATDTIKRMRTNLDPLTPATSTLSPAISHIAETAATLSSSLVERTSKARASEVEKSEGEKTQSQKQTVRWVLDTPQRMRSHIESGDAATAAAEYKDITPLLERWQGVQGVAQLRERCENMLPSD